MHSFSYTHTNIKRGAKEALCVSFWGDVWAKNKTLHNRVQVSFAVFCVCVCKFVYASINKSHSHHGRSYRSETLRRCQVRFITLLWLSVCCLNEKVTTPFTPFKWRFVKDVVLRGLVWWTHSHTSHKITHTHTHTTSLLYVLVMVDSSWGS